MKKHFKKQQSLQERKTSVLEPVQDIFAKHPLFSKRPMLSVYKLQKKWPSLVGEMMAKRSLPVRIKKTCLIIAVENQAWGQQFNMMKPVLLQAIADKLGLHYEDIRFVSEPFHKPAEQSSPQKKKKINSNRSLEEILTSIGQMVQKK
ncbi:MAG TPA: DUF721 domain-containing protein [Oligoflexia bacterium]|nr:DUF721 domain-containing protein [Oligoflexia bacterium]HMR25371.1 DUF721 domain-containing protein [Oligoflexia bacterium]